MASVNFQKCKGGAAAKAILRHCDKEKRLEASHSNESIDKTKTDKNLSYIFSCVKKDGTKFTKQLNYEETCRRYDERIREIDANGNTNQRKDRVTCFALCIPTPENLQEDDTRKFFISVGNILKKKYGTHNLINCYVHFDEIHTYKDAETGIERTSRAHAHFLFVPEKDGQLNGKWFSSRANMTEINKSIDTMCRESFGIRFMDGSKKKSRKTVERLKNESEEIERTEIEKAELIGFKEGYKKGLENLALEMLNDNIPPDKVELYLNYCGESKTSLGIHRLKEPEEELEL